EVKFTVSHGDVPERIEPHCGVKHPVWGLGGLIDCRQDGDTVFTRGFPEGGNKTPVDGFSNLRHFCSALRSRRERHQELWKGDQLCPLAPCLFNHRHGGPKIFFLLCRGLDLRDGDFAHEFPMMGGLSSPFTLSKEEELVKVKGKDLSLLRDNQTAFSSRVSCFEISGW